MSGKRRKRSRVVRGLMTVLVLAAALTGGLIGMLICQGVLSTLNRLYPDYHFSISVGVGGMHWDFPSWSGLSSVFILPTKPPILSRSMR